MKRSVLISVLCFFSATTFAVELSALKEILVKEAPSNYYPKNGEYTLFKNICNPGACFNVVSVFYVSTSNKGMRRIAIFSNNEQYLGSYSGFSESPISTSSFMLRFPKNKYGDVVKFEGKTPPDKIWIDGETHKFEKKL